jgi:putative lipoprotein
MVVFRVLVSALLATGSASATDDWWGHDKALHFGASAGLAAGGYAASTLVLEQPWQRASAGAGFALVLGGAKEGYDALGHGDASEKDFAWDVAGALVGAGLALVVDALVTPERGPRKRASARVAGFRW